MKSVLLLTERVAWTAGAAVLAIWAAASVARTAGAREDIKHFETLRGAGGVEQALLEPAQPDLSSWGGERIRAWRHTLTRPAPAPVAVLRISKIGLEVAVLPGTDDFVLNRGVGHIEDTALPGSESNAGIAGHRDGFFRGLKDVVAGDGIELETRAGRRMYRVERTWVVDPDDVSVLDPTPTPALTLVTCYPFYFIGSAPQRFIVRAVQADRESVAVGR